MGGKYISKGAGQWIKVDDEGNVLEPSHDDIVIQAKTPAPKPAPVVTEATVKVPVEVFSKKPEVKAKPKKATKPEPKKSTTKKKKGKK